MMKPKKIRKFALILSFLLLTGPLSGCAGTPEESAPGEAGTAGKAGGSAAHNIRQTAESGQPGSENTADFPGSYTVPDGWVKADKYSAEDKIFYVEEGHEDDSLPDNISIEVRTNRYSAEEHMQFRDAIVRQLTMQLQGIDAQMTADGTYTGQDYILYVFTIREEDVVTKQYYIVGDRQYCLIHLTSFTGSESADEAAKAMADSFIWN